MHPVSDLGQQQRQDTAAICTQCQKDTADRFRADKGHCSHMHPVSDLGQQQRQDTAAICTQCQI